MAAPMLLDDDDGQGGLGHSWQQVHQHSWSALREDPQGLLDTGEFQAAGFQERRRQAQETASIAQQAVRRGIIRRLYLIVDLSSSLQATDLKPTRRQVVLAGLELFISRFFDENPLSQMGIITTRDRTAQLITELSGDPQHQIDKLREASASLGSEPSLQNALDVARVSLTNLPRYGTREVLCVFSSLTTCDPGNLLADIARARDAGIIISTVGMGAAVRVLQYAADATNGKYGVAMSADHFRQLLLHHTSPMTVTAGDKILGTAIRMGFPRVDDRDAAALCACHQRVTMRGFACPDCKSRVCSLPTECFTCGLLLVAAPHLARSYHHLLPVPSFVARPADELAACFACRAPDCSLACPRCSQAFCFDCDAFVHETLHVCPGCECANVTATPSYPETGAAAAAAVAAAAARAVADPIYAVSSAS